MSEQRHLDVRQEEDRLPTGRILLVAVAALGLSAIIAVMSWVILIGRERALRPAGAVTGRELSLEREASPIQRGLIEPPGPGQRIAEAQRRSLSSFEWADRERDLVNVPIEEGMRRVVEEGGR
ncbi:MAG: hypothetical protein IT372_00785 [Polyangiaceae bacterium]|nr:hypothetical protein [Polyangiaceae bacterium]